jgi:hypothetical protein
VRSLKIIFYSHSFYMSPCGGFRGRERMNENQVEREKYFYGSLRFYWRDCLNKKNPIECEH